MAEKQLPAEVVEAGQKLEQYENTKAARLARLKGDSEDSPTRAAAAVAMKIDGAGYPDIAKVLDYSSAQRARKAVEEAIAEQAGSPEEIEHVRFINNRRLERLLASIMKRATDPHDSDHLAYARMAISLIDRQLKLFGADAPAQVKVSVSPSMTEIERWVGNMVSLVHGVPEEADIVDVEVVEDDSEEGEI